MTLYLVIGLVILGQGQRCIKVMNFVTSIVDVRSRSKFKVVTLEFSDIGSRSDSGC